jgi:hypothetical protein
MKQTTQNPSKNNQKSILRASGTLLTTSGNLLADFGYLEDLFKSLLKTS